MLGILLLGFFDKTEALYRSKIFWYFDAVAFLFLFDKHCPIMG